MRKRRGTEVSLGEAVNDLVRRLGGEEYTAHAEIERIWRDTVGPEVDRRTLLKGLRGGELLVDADSPVWANELAAMSGRISEAINERLGQSLVRAIRFNVSSSVQRRNEEMDEQNAAISRYRESTKPTEELSEADVARIEKAASRIEDEELRVAAVRAAVKDIVRSRSERE